MDLCMGSYLEFVFLGDTDRVCVEVIKGTFEPKLHLWNGRHLVIVVEGEREVKEGKSSGQMAICLG